MTDHITPRQAQILELISQGLSYAVIGERLEITRSSVWQHVHRLYATLGATNAAHAVRKAYELGLMPLSGSLPLKTELARVYAALAVANSQVARQPVEASPSHPFGDYLLGLAA